MKMYKGKHKLLNINLKVSIRDSKNKKENIKSRLKKNHF